MAEKKEANMSLAECLNHIQVNLNAPKGQFNKFGGYKYRSCEDILAAVKPLLKETGCVLNLWDDIVEVGGRIYVKACASLGKNGQTYTTTAFAREPETKKGMDESQITGTASSYARKYALNGLFAIDDTKDADTDEYAKQQQGAPQPAKAATPDLPEPELIMALDSVKRCKTIEELQSLWNELSGWQKNKTFIAEVNKQKAALTSK